MRIHIFEIVYVTYDQYISSQICNLLMVATDRLIDFIEPS